MSNLTCLLIDDDVEDLEVFILALNTIEPPITFITAYDCVQALNLLKSEPTIIPDYIFMDLNMPIIDGKEGLLKIKELSHLSEVDIVIYTTSSDHKDIKETKDLGASFYFVKPSSINFLIDNLTALFKNTIKSFLIKQPDNYI